MAHIPPPSDDYPLVLTKVIDAVIDQGVEHGRAVLEPIAYERRAIARRPGLARAAQGMTFRRDHFTCRYCGGSWSRHR